MNSPDRQQHEGEPAPQPGEWMVEGLKYRDKWRSKILRTVDWSPMK